MESKASVWQDSVWRRPLTDAERAALSQVPELEVEERLTESLAKIPDMPVATNFTARVMDAVDREEAKSTTFWFFRRDWRILLPRVMATAIVLIFTGIFWERYELSSQRVLLAKHVAQVASTKPIPSVEALSNFDAIQRMSQPVTADTEVLALMQ
jgi:hypothetical protein